MVLAVERHKSGIRDRGREPPAQVERNKPVVDAVKDDGGYTHLRQQINNVDIIDRRLTSAPFRAPGTRAHFR